ncbi:MAG: FIST C-terminal domain-containing protein [Syntrophobacteraceae bacterium]|jgi:hypothetical protein
MTVLFDPIGSPANLQEMILKASSLSGVNGLMILACDANGFTPENIDGVLRSAPIPVFGGVFPALMYGKDLIRQGSLVAGLPKVLETLFIPDLSNSAIDYESFLEFKTPDPLSALTMMVFVDGFARRIGAFIESLFNVFGLQMNYIGGGAGSLGMVPKPCLFTGQGMVADGAVLALLGLGSGVGVSHGWTHLSGPYRVTSSDLNVIHTLDWRPALDVYREIVEVHSGKSFDESNFFDIAKSYPFGISRLESEHIVRDPFSAGPDKNLVCIGEVPQGAFVSILNGDESSLIQAAANALELALKAFPTQCEPGLDIFIDCISRVLFLGDRFSEEIESVYRGNRPLVGACTIGEIANCGTEYLEFYNKTAVVAVLGT